VAGPFHTRVVEGSLGAVVTEAGSGGVGRSTRAGNAINSAAGAANLERLPYTVKVLLENMLRGAATHPAGSVIALNGRKPHDVELTERAARGVLGLPPVSGLRFEDDFAQNTDGDAPMDL
jgi:hypothetical protein